MNLGKNEDPSRWLALENVADLVGSVHQVVSLRVVEGGEDLSHLVGDHVHVVGGLLDPAEVHELGELAADGLARDAGDVGDGKGIARKHLLGLPGNVGLDAAPFVVEPFGVAGGDFAEHEAEGQVAVVGLVHGAQAAGHEAEKQHREDVPVGGVNFRGDA